MNKLTSEEKLFSKINHDLRGSFVSILGYTDLLNDSEEELTESEVKEFVSRIGFRTKETFELLESFTNWLKLEKYSKSFIKEKINLFENITSVYSLLKNEFTKKNIDININTTKSEIILFDVVILQSLLKNILLFITKNICQNNTLNISILSQEENVILHFKYISKFTVREITSLTRLNKNEIEHANLPNEILLSKRFIELSGGSFKIDFLDGDQISLSLKF